MAEDFAKNNKVTLEQVNEAVKNLYEDNGELLLFSGGMISKTILEDGLPDTAISVTVFGINRDHDFSVKEGLRRLLENNNLLETDSTKKEALLKALLSLRESM